MATKEELLEAIANMTVMEISDLIKAMEEKFGVTAARTSRCRRGSSRCSRRSRGTD